MRGRARHRRRVERITRNGHLPNGSLTDENLNDDNLTNDNPPNSHIFNDQDVFDDSSEGAG